MPTVTDLGKLVKAKHPEYSDMPDDEVGLRVQAKFPGAYDDFSPGPAVSAPNIRALQTDSKRLDNAGPLNVKDPGAGLIGQGWRQAKAGATGLMQSAMDPAHSTATGDAADLIEGGVKMAAPVGMGALIPAAVAAPVATATGLAGGYVGGKIGQTIGQKGVEYLGGGEDAQRLGGDIGGLAGGVKGAQMGAGAPAATVALAQKIPAKAYRVAGTAAGGALGHAVPVVGSPVGAYLGHEAGSALATKMGAPGAAEEGSSSGLDGILDRLAERLLRVKPGTLSKGAGAEATPGVHPELQAEYDQAVKSLGGKAGDDLPAAIKEPIAADFYKRNPNLKPPASAPVSTPPQAPAPAPPPPQAEVAPPVAAPAAPPARAKTIQESMADEFPQKPPVASDIPAELQRRFDAAEGHTGKPIDSTPETKAKIVKDYVNEIARRVAGPKSAAPKPTATAPVAAPAPEPLAAPPSPETMAPTARIAPPSGGFGFGNKTKYVTNPTPASGTPNPYEAAAQVTRSEKVAKLADLMREAKIDPGQVPQILNDVHKRAMLRDLAKQVGFELPSDLSGTIRELTRALAGSRNGVKVTQ